MKPHLEDFQELYLASLKHLGIILLSLHDIRFVEDNWESPTRGAWGLGVEVWMDGINPPSSPIFSRWAVCHATLSWGEITMALNDWRSICREPEDFQSLIWSQHDDQVVTYADVFHQYEVEMSAFNFDEADIDEFAEPI